MRMTHREFAAKWRATRGGRVGLATVFLTVALGPLAGIFCWLLSDRFFEAILSGKLTHQGMYLTFFLYLIYLLLVALAFVLCAKRLFRRHGFLCPACDRIFRGWDLRHILSGGHCCFCGERVLEEDPPSTASPRSY